ncbi:jg17389 [Pararge aegeria aegeria]|uniref:Jg17389 protein n=1 Tax=Pararge aegeria aegeria TaxID=348720 RepID=A0A8S4S0G4_9NEOP|nr:jg17389 [Pararge aegeria aegeria]
MPLIGLVILMLEMELAMAGRGQRRGSNSAAAPLAGLVPGTQRFSGALRSRRRQLTQIPIKPPALAWGRRSASGRRGRPITSRPPWSARPAPPEPLPGPALPVLSAAAARSAHRGHPNAPTPVTHIAYSTPATDARTVATRPAVATRAMPQFITIYLARMASILRSHSILAHDRRETVAQERKMVMN